MAAWDEADIVALPLLNGGHGIGQVVAREDGHGLILLTLRDGDAPGAAAPISLPEVIALLRVAPDLLNSGAWAVLGFEALPRPRDRLAAIHAPADVQDPAVVEAFLNACHGLVGWNDFPNGLFDGLLFKDVARPPKVRP
jgi:hypothetical protein